MTDAGKNRDASKRAVVLGPHDLDARLSPMQRDHHAPSLVGGGKNHTPEQLKALRG